MDRGKLSSSAAEVWNALAHDYDKDRSSDAVYLACCMAVARRVGPLQSGARLLDAGCGTGIVSLMLAPDHRQLVAVDYSAASLAVLRRKAKERHVSVTAIEGDIRDLPLPSDTFDLVMCANALQHLTPGVDQRRAVRELLRVLKPGGRYVFSFHHYSRHKRRAGWVKEGKPGEPGVDYIYRYTRVDVKELIPAASGIAACGYYGMPTFGSLSLATNLQIAIERLCGPLFARLGLGHMLVAHGTKSST